MEPVVVRSRRPVVRSIGSLWFGAVVLVLLLVAMACATVFESMHGTERALFTFYRSSWFAVLLALLGLNVFAALILRWPFTRRQVGFVLTHISILLVLVGAWVTSQVGIDGQVGLLEGQSATEFTVPIDSLKVGKLSDRSKSSIDLASSSFKGFSPVKNPKAPVLRLGNLSVEVTKYLPDSEAVEIVVNDNPGLSPAIEVSLGSEDHEHRAWLFAGQVRSVGSRRAVLRLVTSEAELELLISGKKEEEEGSDGVVTVVRGEEQWEFPLSECMAGAKALGDTGLTVKVLRYMPHGTVGANNKLVNSSNRPENPVIEVEITGPEGTERRYSFARFPDFESVHGDSPTADIKLSFVAPTKTAPSEQVEFLRSSSGDLYVRFNPQGQEPVVHELAVGDRIESPWPGQILTVRKHYDRARKDRKVVGKEPREKGRIPAVELRVTSGEQTETYWVQKYNRPQLIEIGGEEYELAYGNKVLPLGFKVTLNKFRVGYYPGGTKPRSFESTVTIDNASSGRSQTRVISMNNPTACGGFTLYQSSYRREGDRWVSFLSVSRDPGQPIVFAGYILMMVGMVIVLVTRMGERRGLPSGLSAVGADRVSSDGRAASHGKLSADVAVSRPKGKKEKETVRETEPARRTH